MSVVRLNKIQLDNNFVVTKTKHEIVYDYHQPRRSRIVYKKSTKEYHYVIMRDVSVKIITTFNELAALWFLIENERILIDVI